MGRTQGAGRRTHDLEMHGRPAEGREAQVPGLGDDVAEGAPCGVQVAVRGRGGADGHLRRLSATATATARLGFVKVFFFSCLNYLGCDGMRFWGFVVDGDGDWGLGMHDAAGM